jgi:hypothetical protein
MPRGFRNQEITDYKAGKKRLLLITGAGAEGLDLPDTTMVSLLDGHYNPMKIKQIIGRGVRRGGLSGFPPEKRFVRINKYVADPETAEGSIDWHVYRVAQDKEKAINDLWQAVKQPKWALTPRQKAVAMAGMAATGLLTIPYLIKHRSGLLSTIKAAPGKISNILNKIKGLVKRASDKYDFRAAGTHPISVSKDQKWPFVIQLHKARHKHYDIRLFDPNSKAGHSWATTVLPNSKHPTTVIARQPSHPLEYFNFQGIIPEGYGAGIVKTFLGGVADVKYSNPQKIRFSLPKPNKLGKDFLILKQKDGKWRIIRLDKNKP